MKALLEIARRSVRSTPVEIRDDLYAVALAAAAAALKRPGVREPQRYASIAARNAVIDELRRWKQEVMTISLDPATGTIELGTDYTADGGALTRVATPSQIDFEEMSLLEKIDRDRGVGQLPDVGNLEELLDVCTPRQRAAVELTFGLGLAGYARTPKESAAHLGVSRSRISRLVSSALERMRNAVNSSADAA